MLCLSTSNRLTSFSRTEVFHLISFGVTQTAADKIFLGRPLQFVYSYFVRFSFCFSCFLACSHTAYLSKPKQLQLVATFFLSNYYCSTAEHEKKKPQSSLRVTNNGIGNGNWALQSAFCLVCCCNNKSAFWNFAFKIRNHKCEYNQQQQQQQL